MRLEDNRRQYDYGKLTRGSLSASPFEQFSVWMQQAIDANVQDPTAMSVATVSAEGKPWQRMVLLKDFDEGGFVFYTNLGSRKAQDIEGNAQVSLHFPWLLLDRQVIVGGRAERLPAAQVEKYFLSRPKDSQLAAWASKQSSPISSRQTLETQFSQVKAQFAEGDIPLPEFWGGFCVVPEEIEFWQGGENRLHDRFCFKRDKAGWNIARLSP
jgi:pyridoxamine 5'-phosphate oxidase